MRHNSDLYYRPNISKKKQTTKLVCLVFHFGIIFILFLASFGVYLGRFLRWNSWDIISNPFGLASSILQRFIFPFNHLQTWGVTVMLTTLFYLLYLTIKKMPGYVNQAMQ
jgi:uncharacterized membrane protein